MKVLARRRTLSLDTSSFILAISHGQNNNAMIAIEFKRLFIGRFSSPSLA